MIHNDAQSLRYTFMHSSSSTCLVDESVKVGQELDCLLIPRGNHL